MNEEIIAFLRYAGAALIGLGFIYLIVIRLFNNFNHVKKALVAFITGIILTLAIVVGIIIDDFNLKLSLKNLWYYAFLIVSILMMLIIPTVLFVLGKSRHQQFRNYHNKIAKQKQKVTPTIKDKEEYVYYVFKCKDHYLLKAKMVDGTEYYYSESVKLNKILFHDEMVKELINKYDLCEYNANNVLEAKQIGEALIKGKKDKHYYCYLIELDDKVKSLDDYEMISAYDLFRYNMEDFDKKVLFHIILKEPFNVEM